MTPRRRLLELRDGEVQLWLLRPEEVLALAPLAEGMALDLRPTPRPLPRDSFAHQCWRGRQVALRMILGAYLGSDPDGLRFVPGRHGKPFLDGPEQPHFSASSSEGWWLAGISREEVGVDLERIRPCPDLDAVADAYFSPGERNRLNACLDAQERLGLFYALWTRKESLVKLSGEGLRGLAGLGRESAGRGPWAQDLSLDPGLAASLAARRAPRSFRLRTWPPEAANFRAEGMRPSARSLTLSLTHP